MPFTRNGTERPREPSLQLNIGPVHVLCRIGGRLGTVRASVRGAAVEIPPFACVGPNPLEGGRCLAGSLTGVVASKSVTEASKGALSAVGNRAGSAMAQGRLTVRQTSRAGTKVGHSDPAVPHGWAVAQRIKGTPGITG